MLTLKSVDDVIIVDGLIYSKFENNERYQVCFHGPFTPRYGEILGSVAGFCDCDKNLYDLLSTKKFPYQCTGVIIQNAKTKTFELADLRGIK